MKKLKLTLTSLLAIATLVFIAGCDTSPPPAADQGAEQDHAGHDHAENDQAGHDHGDHGHAAHGAGPHDGTLADWGGGKFHVEFTVDHNKQEATVYILGDDEKTPTPIKVEEIQLSIKDPAMQVTLKAMPLKGESDGSASRFVGNHKSLGVVMEYAGTITGVIDGTPYSGDFKEEPHEHEEKK